MAKYLLVYTGDATAPASQEEGEAVTADWIAWFGSVGDGVVDPGNPTGAGRSVAPDGSVSDGAPSGVTGWSVLEAADHDAAVAHATTCPHLKAGGRVEVLEVFEVM
jgi:hypothetical protein